MHAYGRDPHFTGWPDTFQLNHGSPALQEAMIGELVKRAVGGEASVAVPIGHTMGQLVGLLLVPGLMGMAVCLLAGRGTGVRGSSRDRGPRGAWRLVVGSRRNARVR